MYKMFEFFLGIETQCADRKTWKATVRHFIEAHLFSISFVVVSVLLAFMVIKKKNHNNNKHAYFLLFLHFKSERQIFMHPHQKHLSPALGMQFLGYYMQFHLPCFHHGNG